MALLAGDQSAAVKVEFSELQCLICGLEPTDEGRNHVPADELLVDSRRSVRDFLLRYGVIQAKVVGWDASVCAGCFGLLKESDALSVKFEASLRVMKDKHAEYYGSHESTLDPITGVHMNGEAVGYGFTDFPAPIVEVAEGDSPPPTEDALPIKRRRGRPRKSDVQQAPVLNREDRVKRKPERLKVSFGKVKQERRTAACPNCDEVYQVTTKEEKKVFRAHKKSCGIPDDELYDSEFSSPDSPSEAPSGSRGKPEFQCTQCDFRATGVAGLKIHAATRHPTKPVTCRFCPQEFPSRAEKTKHEKAEHPDEKGAGNSLFCDCCGKTFKTPASLKIHRGEYRYDYSGICEVCGEFAKNVKVHMSTKHRDPPKCEICGVECANYHARKVHLFRAHGIGKKKTRSKYKCPDCPKDFWSKPKMIRHRVMRHNFRPDAEYIFTCEFCQKEFFCKDTWREHRNGHLGITPYECPLCGYATNIDSNLHIHMRQVHKMRLSVAKAAVRQRQAEESMKQENLEADAPQSEQPASVVPPPPQAPPQQLPPVPTPAPPQPVLDITRQQAPTPQPNQMRRDDPPHQTMMHSPDPRQMLQSPDPRLILQNPDPRQILHSPDPRQSVFPVPFGMNMPHIPHHPPPSVANSVSSMSQDSCEAPEFMPNPNADMSHNAMMMRALGSV